MTKFDRTLRDFSSASGGTGKERGIDGMLVTKWDTVDDKVNFNTSLFLLSSPFILLVDITTNHLSTWDLKFFNLSDALSHLFY